MTGRRWRTRYYPAWGLLSVPKVKGEGGRVVGILVWPAGYNTNRGQVVHGQQRSRHWLGGRLAVYW